MRTFRQCPTQEFQRHRPWPALVSSIATLLFLAGAAPVSAATVRTLGGAGVAALESTVDVRALPAVERVERLAPKPFRTRDPEALRQWKSLLHDVPGVLTPRAHQFTVGGPSTSQPVRATAVGSVMTGLSNADNSTVAGVSLLPSDSNLGVGPAHIFEVVNVVGRITPKAGGTPSTFSLRSFFGVDSGFSESDPRMIYDAASGRWFGTFLEYSSTASSIILTVSTSSDPTATFCRYRLGNPATETFLQDFPMVGVSDDKVVVAYNGFDLVTQAFIGGGYYVVNKADLTGCVTTARVVRVPPSPDLATPHPAQSLGATSDLYMPMHGAANVLTLITVSGVPGVTTVTETSADLAIDPWNPPPPAQQPGTSQTLDTGDDRILSAAWQDASLWLTGNEACTPAGDAFARSCLRVVEVRTDTVTVAQQITFDAAGTYYYYPAARPDGSGNLQVVFGASSSSSFAGVWATGRLVTDPPNTLEAPTLIQAGAGAQTDPSGRMGDYSGAAVDPADPTAVWVASEYVRAAGGANWGTVIARLQLGGAAPDLVTSSVTNPPATALVGTAFSVTDTVQNTGTATAGASVSRYYLSIDAVKSAGDQLLSGSRSVPSLEPGATSTGTVTVTIPSSTASGTYVLLACADDTGLIGESSETNNCLASSTAVQVGTRDLVETAVSNPPASATLGSTFTVTDTAQNSGTLSAGSSTTRFYLGVNSTRSGTDRLLTGSRAVAALGPGTSSTGSTTVTVPAGTPAGTYFVIACADDTKVVTESIESNNCLGSTSAVQVTGPDLVETAVSNPPASAVDGMGFTVTDTAQNVGTSTAGASTTRYYLSLDTVKSGSDRLLAGTRAVASLAAGASSTGSVTVTIPGGVPPGAYFILACADDLNAVVETIEGNNCVASASTVQLTAPDLVESAVSDPPPTAVDGSSFTVTDTTQNVGTASAGASTTRYYLSLDTVKNSGDRLLSGTRSVAALTAGASATGAATVTIPANTPPGTYVVLACADDTSVVVESVEGNNCLASIGTVQVTAADLIEPALSDPPTSGVVGTTSFVVTDTTQNVGTASAGASTTRYYLSLDTLKNTGDRLLAGTRSVAALAVGATATGSVTVTIPASTASGTYFLLACADDLNAVAETSETNNCVASATTMQLTAPDLVESAVSDPPATAVDGATFTVTDTVQNIGTATAGPSTSRYYLGKSATHGASDVLTKPIIIRELLALIANLVEPAT